MLIKQNWKYGAMVGNIRVFTMERAVEVYKMFAALCYADLTMEPAWSFPMLGTICTAWDLLGPKLKIWSWSNRPDLWIGRPGRKAGYYEIQRTAAGLFPGPAIQQNGGGKVRRP